MNPNAPPYSTDILSARSNTETTNIRVGQSWFVVGECVGPIRQDHHDVSSLTERDIA